MVHAAYAIPAEPTPVKVQQPDGSTITVSLVGDEYYHFNTTVDGYTIVNNKGRWEYAQLSGGKLVASGMLAHDAAVRSASELSFLSTIEKRITDREAVSGAKRAHLQRDNQNAQPKREPVVDYSKFRGLILLINFTDRQFLMDDPNNFYDEMSNKENYTGFYTGSGWNRRFNSCTGSVRDYFSDQSMGQFNPVFDIIGPVNVPFASTECGERYSEVFRAALDSIDGQVDFTKYDSDSNGEIDMVFFLVAGYAASYSGNSDEYLWPHMSYLYGWNEEQHRYEYLIYDGMYMGRYASSTEIYGWEAYGMKTPNGIGTVCHEFSHVLGLPDLYDTDYERGGGQSNDPGEWDVMAGGSYGNSGRTPVGYSLWERTELGWTEPITMELGSHRLESIDKSNEGFILDSPVEGEFFMFENRQNNKWDASLPGHGLLVVRVDYTNPRVWWNNTVNCNPTHNYYELLRAGGTAETTAFPSSAGVTFLTATSEPGLVTWGGVPCDMALMQITESNGIITFNCEEGESTSTIVEDFETMPVTEDRSKTNVKGRFATWNFLQANVAEDEAFSDSIGCLMGMPAGLVMTSDIDADIYMVSAKAINGSAQEAKLELFYSTDQGTNWKSVDANVIAGNSDETTVWRFTVNSPVRFRITRIAGNKQVDLKVDDITIHYTGELRPIEVGIVGDVNGDGKVDVEDVNAAINIILDLKTPDYYIGNADVNGDGKVDVEDVNAIINIILNE